MNTKWSAKFRWSMVMVMCLFFGGVSHAADPSAAPKKFSVAIGGFLGGSFRVEMTAPDALVYTHNPRTFTGGPNTNQTTVKVTDAQWKAFRSRLDAAKVWTWKSDYVNNGILDGTLWNLTADFGDKKIESHGRNAYPDQAQFDAMLAAVRELLGGKDFR
ncbi:MAG TPA: hypothetical protein VK961_07135 [Chthoniobacter sp.]|nr:hypothetical protein [Chthoniobacter sp.]